MSTTAASHGTASHSSDGHDDSLAAPDRPFNGVIIAAIVFTLSTIGVIIFGTFQLFEYTTATAEQEMMSSPVDKRLSDLRAAEQKALDGYKWIDQKNNVVRIPAERAEALVLREWTTRATGTVANPIGGPAAVAPAPAEAAPVAPAATEIHPPHRLGLPAAPNAPGRKPAAAAPAKPKVK